MGTCVTAYRSLWYLSLRDFHTWPCTVFLLLQALVHLAPLPGGGIGAADVDVPAAVTQLEQQQQDQALDFLGPLLSPEVAQGIAEGGACRMRRHIAAVQASPAAM